MVDAPRIGWSPDGTRLAIATRDNSVALFDGHSGEMDGGLESIISNLVFQADGQELVVFTGGAGGRGRWRVWRADRQLSAR
ncbi:MAG: hypothetical protein AB7O59_15260 [Pirellulales bacterium]